jgi:hypothetical protein
MGHLKLEIRNLKEDNKDTEMKVQVDCSANELYVMLRELITRDPRLGDVVLRACADQFISEMSEEDKQETSSSSYAEDLGLLFSQFNPQASC